MCVPPIEIFTCGVFRVDVSTAVVFLHVSVVPIGILPIAFSVLTSLESGIFFLCKRFAHRNSAHSVFRVDVNRARVSLHVSVLP